MKLFVGIFLSVAAQVAEDCPAKCAAMYQPDKDYCNQEFEGDMLDNCLGKVAYYVDKVWEGYPLNYCKSRSCAP